MNNATKNDQPTLLDEKKGEFHIPPVRPRQEQIKDPYQVLENFLTDYPIEEFRDSF